MALTQDEIRGIVSAVLSSLQTNSRTIDQLTPVTSLSDNDYFEINGGKKVSYGVFIDLIKTLYSTEQDTLKTLINKCELSSVAITEDDGIATLTISSKGKEISTSIPIVSTIQAGLMTSKDKQKLETAKETASTAKNMAESAINNIGTESSLRANADNELRAAIALLRSSLDNLKESAGNDIDSIDEQLRSLRDHIEDSLSELRPIEVESEEAMAGLIASGEIDDNRMYYIPESD